MIPMKKVSLSILLLMLLSLSGFGGPVCEFDPGAPAADKWQYHLFHPVPRERVRPLSADRPDATESPYTVDAGHFQAETSFATFSRDETDGVETTAWSFGAFNFKAGLLNNVDLQFLFDSYTRERTVAGGEKETSAGFSDLRVRLKVNLWGNDGGRTALGLIPFVKIPTRTELSNDKVEGGVIAPFAMDLTQRIGLGLQAELDFVHDQEANGYEVEFLHTAVVGFEVTERLGAYLEYVGVSGSAEYQASASGGVTFSVTDDMVLDAGAVVGLNDAAEDLTVFTGLTIRY